MELLDRRTSHPSPQLPSPSRVPQRPALNQVAGVVERPRAVRPLRLAVLLELAPRKLGSMEDWIGAVCEEARARGHALDVYCHAPVHPVLRERLEALGVGIRDVAELARRPLEGVGQLKGYDVLHIGYFGARARVSLMAYAAWPARVLYVDHSSGVPGQEQRAGVRRLVSRVLDRATQLRLAGIAGVSDYVRERDRRRFGTQQKVQTILNGVSLERFRPARLPREAGRAFRLVTVAHLQPHKGVDVAIRALAAMQERDVELLVVGDGPESQRLQALAHGLGVADRVQLLGLRSDVDAVLAQADVLVHPATWLEAFGLTIAEAMACGLPVVATRTGGIPEVVEDGRSGLLVPPGDADSLARALDELLRDEGARERMGAAARARAEALFDVRVCAARHVDWMEQSTARQVP